MYCLLTYNITFVRCLLRRHVYLPADDTGNVRRCRISRARITKPSRRKPYIVLWHYNSARHVQSVPRAFYLMRRLPIEFLNSLKSFTVVQVPEVLGLMGQYLMVWAVSPDAPQIGHLYALKTGHMTRPSACFNKCSR